MKKDVSWTFTTPPPKVEQMIPANQTTRRDVPMFVRFDQEVNPTDVIETLSVTSKGKNVPIRLLSADEIKNSNIQYYVNQSQPKRWVAFRAVNAEGGIEDALPADSPISVTIKKGTASAEGPLKTEKAQGYSFKTFGAMKFVKGYCNYQSSKNCSPFDTWYMQFTNSIDSSKFDKSMVKIEPAIEGVNIYPSGRNIYIQGYKKGRTTYKVTVDDTLQDTFTQTLQEPARATFKVGSAPMSLYAQGGNFVVLDPTAKSSFSIYSINHKNVKVKLYKVQPENWHQFNEYLRRINYDDDTKRPVFPANSFLIERSGYKSKPDEMVETRIDLSKALAGGLGNVIIDIQPTVKRDKYDRTRIFTWAQSTQIGLDAFVDKQELVGFATEMKTGKPLSGVELSIYPNGTGVKGQQVSQKEEESTFTSWWNWLTTWGSSDPGEVYSVDENGNSVETETVEPAQTNRTGTSGVLRLPLPDSQAKKQNLLIAKRGNDVAFLPEHTNYYWQNSGSWYKKGEGESLRWFVFDDRKMYRPKEEVAIKGYIRKISSGKLGDVQPLGDSASGLTYRIFDPRGNEIGKGTANLNVFGAFDFKFKLPDNANLGYGRVQLSTNSKLGGSSMNHSFQIQEFRRPEFEVSSRSKPKHRILLVKMQKYQLKQNILQAADLQMLM